jgi:ankyrin repeat protein
VALLLSTSASANASDRAGLCALHCAAANGDLPVADLLINYSAEINK